jgi:2-(1,2-epoxy-1,2-dihydrophenyl)acetyl-CoA isomerase
MSELLILSSQSGAVRTLMLNRPDALSRFTNEMHPPVPAALAAKPLPQDTDR